MNTKNLLVSLCTFAFALFLIGNAAAVITVTGITVDGINVSNTDVVAGEDVTFKVYFTSTEAVNETTLELEIDAKHDVGAMTGYFDMIPGQEYVKKLSMKVPYELKDEKTDLLNLIVKIEGKESNFYDYDTYDLLCKLLPHV